MREVKAQSSKQQRAKARQLVEEERAEGGALVESEISEALNTSGTLPDATAGRDQRVGGGMSSVLFATLGVLLCYSRC